MAFDCGHYDPYVGAVFEVNVGAQVAFLSSVLAPSTTPLRGTVPLPRQTGGG